MPRGSLQTNERRTHFKLNGVPSVLKLLELISCELLRVKIVTNRHRLCSPCSLQVSILWLSCGCHMLLFSLYFLPLCPSLSLSLQLINDFCTFSEVSLAWHSIVANTSTGRNICRVATKIGFASQLRKRGREREQEPERERERQQINVCLHSRFLVKIQQQVRLAFLLARRTNIIGLNQKSLLGYCACHQEVAQPLPLLLHTSCDKPHPLVNHIIEPEQ